VRNEDTDEAIQCPHCGSEDDCPHLLAVIDRSFLECSGGYAYDRFDEFRTTVEGSFLKQLQMGTTSSKTWNDEHVRELWIGAMEEYSKTGELCIDGYVLFRLIVNLLEEAGGDEHRGPIVDDGGPGFSSAITLFYANNPQEVFARAVSDLKDRLSEPPK